jgi:hypothetical protein
VTGKSCSPPQRKRRAVGLTPHGFGIEPAPPRRVSRDALESLHQTQRTELPAISDRQVA